MQLSLPHLLLLLPSLLLLLHPSPGHSQHLENDLQSLLHDLDGGGGGATTATGGEGGGGGGDDDFEVELVYKPDDDDDSPMPSHSSSSSSSSSSSWSGGVRRLWGVEDSQAVVGRVFSLTIPDDAFQGDVQSYQVKGLPGWLSWDVRRGTVEGVPRPSERGHHYVTLRARGKDGSSAKDVFAVDVIPMPGSQLSHEGKCRARSDVTVLSVLLDAHLSTLTPRRRLDLLRGAQTYLGLNASLVPAAPDTDPLGSDVALQAGPGSATLSPPRRNPHRSLAQLHWVVGCEGEVQASRQAAVDRIEVSAKNGQLQRVLGVPVLGWFVIQVNPRSNRVRREVDYSGDYALGGDKKEEEFIDEEYGDEYDDYYTNVYDYNIYDYGEDHRNKKGNVLNFDYETHPIPETRNIPTLATPTFPETSATLLPTSSSAHGRVHPDPSLHFSPVFISTPSYVPVKPTRVLDASPTVAPESSFPTQLPNPVLESSLPPQPSPTPISSTPLTTTVTTSPDLSPASSHPIDPTSVHTHTQTDTISRNYSPRVKNRIEKLAWIAGHVYRLSIPRDTFEDLEDGDTRNLHLELKTSQERSTGYNSWIRLNQDTQEIYALPLEKNVGRYTFFLVATDSEGKSDTENIKIHVQQPREGRNYNHRFTAVFKTEKNYEYEFPYSLDRQIKAVEKIAHLYGDPDTSNINVRGITTNPNKLTWTNTTFVNPRSTDCPTDDLEAVVEVVSGGEEHGMTREVREAFRPEFHLSRVNVHYMGSCERLKSRLPLPPPQTPHTDKEGKTEDEIDAFDNRQPIIRNPIDLINATTGTLLRFQVPEDTCYDLEDGDSHKLKMRLLTEDLAELSQDSWLQFDPANHEFFGVPLHEDVGKTEYNLECVDKGGKKVIDALFVNVMRRVSPNGKMVAAQFSLTLQHNFREFMRAAHLKARFVERIASAFGDLDTRHVAIDDFRRGSVVVTWHNASLPSDPCPEEDVMKLRKLMLDDDGALLPSFVEAFAPEYRVVGGKLTPMGVCLGGDTPTHIEEEPHLPPAEDSIKEDDDDYLINFIIPAVIIAAMLLLAAVVACCLYRRRRYGKMTMADDNTFVSRGIPVIFNDELDDQPDPAKSPVIMKDEKPPLPPPEYQRGPSPSHTTPPTRRPHSGEGGDDAPSYQPPPPFTATNGATRHPRPNMPPTYRKPPTYVPP